jgi:hypothetical protein
VTAAEVLGRPGVQTLGAVARRTGKTADALEGALTVRESGAGDRMLDDFSHSTGIDPEAVAGDFASHAASLRAKAAPLYDAAYAQPSPMTAPLADLMRRPSMRRALARATRIAAEEGRDPSELGFRFEKVEMPSRSVPLRQTERVPGGGTREVVVQGRTGPEYADVPVQVENPTMQTMDYVKRGLDDIIESYRDKTTGRLNLDEEGRATLRTLNAFRSALTDPNTPGGPAYKAALDAGGDPLRLEQAYRDFPKLLVGSANERVFAERLGKLSPAELDAAKGGVANLFYDMARGGKLKPGVLKTPAVRGKLTQLMGADAAGKFIALAEAEGNMAKYGSRMKPGVGSPTMEFLDAGNQQDHVTDGLVDFGGRVARGQGPISAFIGTGLKKGGAYLETAGTPVEVRDEMGRVLSMHPDEFVGWLQDMEAQMGARQPRRPLPKSPYGVIGGSSQREDARATP